MNKILIKGEVEIIYGNGKINYFTGTISSADYKPGDYNSMCGAIDKIATDIEEIRKSETTGKFSRIRIELRREDESIINEIDPSDIETTNSLIQQMCII